ncbi:glycosyl hydrolase family 28-related protein [Sulfitobacter sabulilitoris]|uniref:Right-handed parallel beta-helix repeat-containing protein n=1 Tax=Sulfitobacter sabulilitoris TaxID=2562655 RepID=A0A5S3PBU7_9RHOB|nr:glycosyl hydrolase family 28-related protein [Sulfitobacter sabulilitoris]TMM51162.1 right-handed parallel beta-helix repeat-containing protein [Sulfitobacter sabulilitoris]
MNKAITDGVLLMPPAFANGLDVYSSGDGTPGSDTYDADANAAFVPADQDFGGCLELFKTQGTQKLRYTGQTPLLPGCYLRITVRIKAVSGNLPSVRIAGYAALGTGAAVPGVVTTGPSVALSSYGEVVEVSAIVGAGARGGVDMVWGAQAVYGHFGLDLTGQNGGVVRIDDIVIEDITSVFLRDIVSTVDVRDYGAVGDGTTDDTAAFEAANAAAGGRTFLVPEGTYRLNGDVTIDAPTQFEGTVTMPADAILLLRKNFDFAAYAEAFDDEEEAFRKGFQALLNNADHEAFDLGGRKIDIFGPIDMQVAAPGKSSYATRRVIRNGQLEAKGEAAWAAGVVTSQATYSASDSRKLTGVINVANIEVGSLVEGAGVGREVYVRDKNVGRQEVTLSAQLFDAQGTQNFTFRRFRYMLDFSGFNTLSKFIVSNIEFQCNNVASAINLAPEGLIFQVQDCFFTRPRDRAITSIGNGCQGMLIDRSQFLSAEDALDVPDRVSIAINTNGNDIKLRDCRATKFKHFALIGGANSLISGNHFFQGDAVQNGIRSAGLILTKTHNSSTVMGNYVDNCFIEWSNEQDSAPEFNSEFSFSALGIHNNIFLSGEVAPWFSYIVVKPHGAGHFLSGVSVTGNHFRTLNGPIDRVERIDTSFADLNYGRMKNVTFSDNSFHSVTTPANSPLSLEHDQASTATTWVIDTAQGLPFGAHARSVDSIVATQQIRNAAGVTQFEMPYVNAAQGTNQDQVQLVWSSPMRGRVQIAVRMDA